MSIFANSVNWVKKHRLWTAAIALAILFVAVQIKMQAAKRANEALTDPLRKGNIVESVYGIGTVKAQNSFQLKIGVVSAVKKLYVTEGDYVKRGQKLVELEDTGSFNAPFDGTITYLPVKVGESIFAQGIILTLVDLSNRYVVVSVEQRAAIKIHQGQKAKLSFENMRDQAFEGIVESVYSHENDFLVRIGTQNLPTQILPGMTADVSIAIGEHQNVLLIPTAAIDAGKVYVKRPLGRRESVDVKIGIVDTNSAEVTSGDLHEGDQLFVRKGGEQ